MPETKFERTRRRFRQMLADFSDERRRYENWNVASSSRRHDPPPPYEDAIASSQRPREPARVLNIDGMNPLVAAAYKNQMLSPLIRLPDALIIAIMQRADIDDILRLRHVSRDFMRLFSQPAFQKYHLLDAPGDNSRKHLARIWATPQQHYTRQSRSTLCDSCIAFRKQKGYNSNKELLQAVPFFRCAGCKMEHRAFYFSAQQRHESSDAERLCLSHEGSISLCNHKSITWDLAQRLADNPSGKNMLRCNDDHHRISPCRHVRNETSKICRDDEQPRIVFYRDKEQNLCFRLSVTAHIPFKSGPD